MNQPDLSQMSAFARSALPFLDSLDGWVANLPVISIGQAFPDPARGALLSVDVIHGFCVSGALASPRVGAIVQPVTALMQAAWDHGLRHFILSQDTHEPDAVEFGAWPRHCVRGTPEAETVAEIRALPFFDRMIVQEKNSIHAGANTALNDWLAAHPEVDSFIVVGDCTDLCVYQLAMHLRTDADARQLQRRVIVPANAVDTYDYSLEAAGQTGGMAHPGELMHALFLYHMALNGVEVVRAVA